MSDCDHIRDQIALFLDGELHEEERSEFESHLSGCPQCSELTGAERDFLANLSDLRPLYQAPAELRSTIASTLASAPAPIVAPSAFRRRLQTTLFQSASSPNVVSLRRRVVLLALVLVVLSLGVLAYSISWRRSTEGSRPSELAAMAVESHLRRLRGQLPLEVVSDSPEEISGWFRDKVPFSLTLPNYQKASGQEQLYYLEGARLVALKSEYAACIAYRMRGRPITLIVTSNAVAMPAGGETMASKGLSFHYDAISGLKVITWADRGLTYALVSDLEERGQQSCIVCHEGTKDRDFLEGFKPSAGRS